MSGQSHVTPIASKLKISILIVGVIFVVELVGGLVSNSLALLSDAGHVFADLVALSLSWYAVNQAQRPASNKMTFGYHRVGVIVAVVNAITILAIAIFIFYEAIRRFQEPLEINSVVMSVVATIGLLANIFVVYWLKREQKESLNIRSAFWHAMGDMLASIGVIVGGIIIYVTGVFEVDIIVSVLIGLIIIGAAWRIFKEGFRVLLEATPTNVNVEKLLKEIRNTPGVREVHDIHVWSISPEINAMSCHVLLEDRKLSETQQIRSEIESILKRYSIDHSVIQMECKHCGAGDIYCKLPCSSDEKGDNLEDK
ncbi:MAG: cation diffusion facilitator family transporter [Dehalogenimonas sp.]